MILTTAHLVKAKNPSRYAWMGLRKFQYVPHVQEQIIKLHKLDKKQHANAKKQANQIRYCLTQAEEYFTAAASVSLATKPNLLYYSIMSLALAEILLKQTGLSSLDKAREQHKHHGLTLRVGGSPNPANDLRQAASALVATPLVRENNERFGTFELWHRSCREMPMAGDYKHFYSGGAVSTQYQVIFMSADEKLEPIPEIGLSLFNCIVSIPGMLDFLGRQGIAARIIRGQTSAQENENPVPTVETALVIHPGPQPLLDEFFKNLVFNPNDTNRINFREVPSGAIVKWVNDSVNGGVRCRLPHGTMWTKNEIRFWPTAEPLNEFGYLYVALHIAGNYARYYPDRWLADVDQSSPLAVAVEELLSVAESRVALLALSELSRTYHVIDD